MLELLCKLIIAFANADAYMSCSGRKWGEEDMPDALKKLNEK